MIKNLGQSLRCTKIFGIIFLTAVCNILFVSCDNTELSFADSPVDYVNPLIGSDSSFELSNGNTYPAIARPWGMNFWTPQTGLMGDGWGYTYKSEKMVGIKQTHQPSPWINDYGAFSLMPGIGELKVKEEDRKLSFNHTNEVVQPHYYSVLFHEIDTKVELTTTERSAYFRFSFPKVEEANIIIDAFNKGSEIMIYPDQKKIIGVAKNNSGGVPSNFANYFIMEFNTPFKLHGTWTNSEIQKSNKNLKGEHVGAFLVFDTQENSEVLAKVSSSFINHAQASINLNREIPENISFDQLVEDGKLVWNNELSKIKVASKESEKTNEDLIKFYSSLYRTILFPRQFHEYDLDNNQIHYSPYDGNIYDGPLYTDNGFWDTFKIGRAHV